jgi:hypothetical protein
VQEAREEIEEDFVHGLDIVIKAPVLIFYF